MLLVRQGEHLAATFSTALPYMEETASPQGGDLGLQGTRGAEVLKLWLGLQHLGLEGIDAVISAALERRERLAGLLDPLPLTLLPGDLHLLSFQHSSLAGEALCTGVIASTKPCLISSFGSRNPLERPAAAKAVLGNPFTGERELQQIAAVLQAHERVFPRGRWVAIATGVISVLLALAYLALVMVLDRQGPLRPPPPEAFAAAGAVPGAAAPPPSQSLLQKTAEIEVASIQVVLTTHNFADAAIPPGLLLAEVGDEAFASQSRQPGGGDRLNRLAGNQGGQLAAEGGPQQAGSPLTTPKLAKVRPSERAHCCPCSRLMLTP